MADWALIPGPCAICVSTDAIPYFFILHVAVLAGFRATKLRLNRASLFVGCAVTMLDFIVQVLVRTLRLRTSSRLQPKFASGQEHNRGGRG